MLAVQEDGLGRPVVAGNDDGRVENTPVKVVQKKNIRLTMPEDATAFYEDDRLILERFEEKISALPQPFAGFRRNKVLALKRVVQHPILFAWVYLHATLLRLYYVAVAEWKTERLRYALLSWLSTDQIFALACWYINTKSVSLSFYNPRLWISYLYRGQTKAWHAHECTEWLVLRHCHRDSKEPQWRQGLYHYWNARALHARGFPVKMVQRSIEKAVSATDQWIAAADQTDPLFARKKCVCIRIDAATFYWRLAESEWVNNEELFGLSRKMFAEAKDLASAIPQEISASLQIDTLLEKMAFAEKQVLSR